MFKTKRTTFLRATIAIAGLVMASLAFATPASAAEGEEAAELVNALESFWTEYDVPQSIQQELVDGIEAGNYPDSLTGASDFTTTKMDADGFIVTIATFEDGSIAVSGAEKPQVTSGKMSPKAINGCSVSSGAGWASYTGCQVYGTNGQIQFGFKTGFTRAVGAWDFIHNSGSEVDENCVVYNCSWPQRSYYKKTEDSISSARLTYRLDYSIPSVGSGTAFLSLMVGGDTYTTDFEI